MVSSLEPETDVDLDVEGSAAPPRDNGELVFAEPWESRAFGLAVAMSDAGVFEWEAFRQALIASIRRWDRAHPDGQGYSYYERWLEALETLLDDRGLVSSSAVGSLAVELASRPAGHDHPEHDH